MCQHTKYSFTQMLYNQFPKKTDVQVTFFKVLLHSILHDNFVQKVIHTLQHFFANDCKNAVSTSGFVKRNPNMAPVS